MKTKLTIFLVVLMIASINLLEAQTFPHKSTATTSVGYIPQINALNVGGFDLLNNSLIFQSATGNIGIGTATPGYKLDVTNSTGMADLGLTSGSAGHNGYYTRLEFNDYYGSTITSEIVFDYYGTYYANASHGVSILSGRSGFSNIWFRDNSAGIMGGFVNTTYGTTPTLVSTDNFILGGKEGIGTISPSTKLEVDGTSGTTLKIVDGNQGTGKVLTSDANGVASWSALTSTGAWNLTGNSLTIPGTDFLGTTDAKDLMFKVNGYQSGLIDINFDNTLLGYQVGNSMTSGAYNTGIGYNALYSNVGGNWNTAVGMQALNISTTGGDYNTAIGGNALLYNTTGTWNTATGAAALAGSSTLYQTGGENTATGGYSLNNNTTGSYNTATGINALRYNTSGIDNTAIGAGALELNSTGNENIAIGFASLESNNTGSNNIAIGTSTLETISTQSNNIAIGNNALAANTGTENIGLGINALAATTGNNNTALGYLAGAYENGSSNTFLGYSAIAGSNNLTDATAIGNSAVVPGSDDILLGITSISLVGAWVGWHTFSDGRFKTNITENVKGLVFINKLRPITYNLDTKAADDFLIQNMPDSIKIKHQTGIDFTPSTAVIHSGFIAQEVDAAEHACGFTSSIVHRPANITDPYSLSYEEIVVPLVKAVQELSKTIDSLKTSDSLAAVRASNQTSTLNSLLSHQRMTDSLLTVLQNCCSLGIVNKTLQNNSSQQQDNLENTLQVELANNSQPILYQNEPNPFGSSTVIRYFIPENISVSVYIVFFDMYGKELKKTEITTNGFGNIDANTEKLASGIYSYSLLVNDKVIDTKKMIKNK